MTISCPRCRGTGSVSPTARQAAVLMALRNGQTTAAEVHRTGAGIGVGVTLIHNVLRDLERRGAVARFRSPNGLLYVLTDAGAQAAREAAEEWRAAKRFTRVALPREAPR